MTGDDSGKSGSENGTNDGSSNGDCDPKRTREQRSPQKDTSQKKSRLRRSLSEEPSHIDRITSHTQARSDSSPPRSVLKQVKGWFGL